MKAIWIVALLAAPLAHAHITVAPATAPAGAYQTLVFKVGHGCAGSATTGITVQLPEGVTAKPMPKPGWTIALAPREIAWRGGPLPDAYYDEFTVQAKLPDAPGRYVFKVGQQCEKGRMDWADVNPESKTPAPVLEVTPAAMPMHHH
ncbi:hypothetical protein SAMN05428966_11559 [Massilia sp. PDC64]|nr:YcnI family protein [Massilia sp. PDC64]SDF40724.1 hypothetical protein SAMN05428966_11559 [Massilia sp. PDC64]